jgi:hypothetical protein
MRRTWIAGILALCLVLFHSDDAEAFTGCNEACLFIAYALVTGSGLVSAAISQVQVIEGKEQEDSGYLTLGLAGANGVTSGVLLIVAGVMAATEEDELATGFAIWGGIQMTIAIAGLVSGATVVANADERAPPGAKLRGEPMGATLTFEF